MKNKEKNLWILYLILSIVVIVCLYLTKKNDAWLIVFSPLLFLIILYIFLYKIASENITIITIRGAIVGGIIGWIWGLINIVLGAFMFERDITFIKILIGLPFYLSYTIFKSEHLFVPFTLIIGILIGALIGFIISIISKIRRRNNE